MLLSNMLHRLGPVSSRDLQAVPLSPPPPAAMSLSCNCNLVIRFSSQVYVFPMLFRGGDATVHIFLRGMPVLHLEIAVAAAACTCTQFGMRPCKQCCTEQICSSGTCVCCRLDAFIYRIGCGFEDALLHLWWQALKLICHKLH